MTAFRDEHAALLERVARLEEDLADARRRGADATTIVRELDELAAKVSEATARAQADRDALGEVGAAIERMRREVAPPETREPPKSPPTSAAASEAQSSARLVWLAVLALVGIGIIVIYIVGSRNGPPAPTPEAMPGTLDPSAMLARARASAFDAGLSANGALVAMKVHYASVDGLLHLRDPHYEASVEFDFAPPPAAPVPADSSAPLGAPGHNARPSFVFDQSVTVTFNRQGVRALANVFLPGTSDPVPDPHCSVADVWKAAIEAGAPRDAVASVSYEYGFVLGARFARTPRWHFAIASTTFEWDVADADCRVVR